MQTYSVALPILLGYIVWILKNQKKDRDANSEGTKMLLMVKLIEYHDKYMELGCIPSHAYDNFQKMYRCYVKMGDGNTSVEKMHQEIEDLNLKQKKEGNRNPEEPNGNFRTKKIQEIRFKRFTGWAQ